MLALYNLLAWLVSPLALLHLALRQRGALRLSERLGGVHARTERPVWIQAASVGEVRLALRLCHELSRRGVPVLLTSTTATGLALASRESEGRFPVFACPLDCGPTVRRTFTKVRPRALVLVETELWPGLLSRAHRLRVPVAVVNARLSDRSLNHFHLLKTLLGPLLQDVTVAAQDEENARRFTALGSQPHRTHITGNMKYDIIIPCNYDTIQSHLAPFFPSPKPPLWVAGSVREGEEALVLRAHRQLLDAVPGARLLFAPRHLNRLATALEEARKLGLTCALRSQPPVQEWDVLFLDSIGELIPAYGLGDVAFAGGSLVALGGQNPLEPALVSKPVLFGPSMENFRLEAERLEADGGGFRVDSAESLTRRLALLLADGRLRDETGRRARDLLAAHAGATSRTADLLCGLCR